MTRAGERKIAKKEQVNGGAGHVLMEALLNEEERGEHCRIFSQVTIEPGCELGYHEHHGETECAQKSPAHYKFGGVVFMEYCL